MDQKSLRQLTAAGVIAAAYAALSLAVAPLSFGAVQCRIAEALPLLAVLSPAAVWGAALGCAITNTVGVAMGVNFLGALDILCGTVATLVATLLCRAARGVRLRGLPLLSALPAVLVNAVVIGGEWCWGMTGGWSSFFWLAAAQVALGQLPPCLLGAWLVRLLERRGLGNIMEGDHP